MKHIVFTRHDGGVSVCTPTRDVLRQMELGGLWSEYPRWYVDEQVHRQMLAGIRQDHAVRFARAVAYGGVGEREAYEIISDRDTARLGTLHELQYTEDLPGDRWFRDAWRRSSNGGPIGIDLEKAREIQWSKIETATRHENNRRAALLRPLPPICTDGFREAVLGARDADDLRGVWPAEVKRWQ